MYNSSQPVGIRRLGVVAVADLADGLVDFPVADDSLTVEEIPLKRKKAIATIECVQDTAHYQYEKISGRLYEDYLHQVEFELAGLTRLQSIELSKYHNTGVLIIAELHSGEVLIIGTKLAPIVLTIKGTTGKKGGDKRGYTIAAIAPNCPAPPIYLAGHVPWITNNARPFTSAFSNAFR